jgi:aminoglycoside 6'-N-acetyltransferase
MHQESKSRSIITAMLPMASPRLVLRRMQSNDLQRLVAYRNDPRIARFQGWETMSEEAAVAFLDEQKSQAPLLPGQWLQIAITLKATDLLIGDCGLKIHTGNRRQASIGFTLAHDFHGKGFATEAVSTLLDYVFGELSLHRVQADTDPQNTAAWRLLERLGLRREAHLRQSLWFKGRWADEYIYATLSEEWLNRERSLKEHFLVRPKA